MMRCRLIAAMNCCLVLSSCALSEQVRQITDSISQAQSTAQDKHEHFLRATQGLEVRKAAQEVDRPWLAGRAQPLAREVTLPPALRANVNTTLMFADGPLDLTGIAQRITLATHIPVHVRPDALLPLEQFLPRLAQAGQSGSTVKEPTRVTLAGGSEPLGRILDRIGARLGVMWRYQQDRIEFYRTETRVFNVRALTLNASAQASLGLSGDNNSEGFVSTSRTSLDSGQHDVLAVVRARIEPFLSRSGVLVAEAGASSSIVVTDTPDVLQQIAAYLEHENRALTRRVRLIFEELTIVVNDHAEAGLDWNLVFSSAKVAAAMTMAGAGMAEPGMISLGLKQGSFQGSDAIVKALSEVGRVVRRSSLPVLTLNRRPVTHAVRTTFSYIDKVQTTALASSLGMALPSVSVSQQEETVGSLLTLVPDAQEDGQILLSVAYDNTVAQPLKSVTFGDKDNPLQLQQITIDGNGTVQQVALQPGQPLLISGFDRTQEETEGRRLNPGMPLVLGGSDRASRQSLMTVMIVTAQVEEGF
ncbi:hypothetical protein [Pollutimonas harenae]|uniref:Type IVB pilus formation R64 PilN family outer membrane protein n=1 Tax=Pollutimonas harenae TaxID=657015 RepID=A0A853GRQ6_9BURK|nr:hypothetical protein [Pollutimonas harenae]NYT85768.1 hypothetical protein [Pollutimonas harenae]TEA70833.1 hypothetical protein ERD84_09220 [Pollutimonas harenae]